MRLGEMLVRDNRISTDDLDRALAHQTQGGGRLGSILVEMGLLDAESLTIYLGLELGIPIATGATMERCKRSAVRLLNPEQAARLRCIPIVIQGQTLIVAVDDPHDMWVLDEISTLTGYRVLPRVAPEVRIFYYLERFYGVPRPPRWARLGDSPRGSSDRGQDHGGLPAPPLPGLPPQASTPIRPPTPAPELDLGDEEEDDVDVTVPSAQHALAPAVEAVPAERSEAYEAIEVDAADLIEVLDEDDAEVAGQAPPSQSISMVDRSRPNLAITQYEPLSLDAALAEMAQSTRRGAIADLLLQYAASVFEVSCLFMVRDNMAFGWKGFGPTVDPERVEALLIPLHSPSMFQVARHSESLFRGRAFPATLHSYLFKVLRCPAPPHSVVVEVSIGNRPVNLLYGHKTPGEDIADDEIQGLLDIAQATADAYIRLISVAKKRSKTTKAG